MKLFQILVLALLASLAIFMRRTLVTRDATLRLRREGCSQLPTPEAGRVRTVWVDGGWPFELHCAAHRLRRGWRRPFPWHSLSRDPSRLDPGTHGCRPVRRCAPTEAADACPPQRRSQPGRQA